jgi:hypothetical protein
MARKRFSRNIVGSSDAYKGYSHKLYIIEVHNNMSNEVKEILDSSIELDPLRSFEDGLKKKLEEYKLSKSTKTSV